MPNGGPDGGDGGRGGDVIFEIDEGQNTLGDYRHRRKYKAEDGQEGGKKTLSWRRWQRCCPESSGRNGHHGCGIRQGHCGYVR